MGDDEQVATVRDTTAAVVGSLVGKVPVIGEALVVRDAYARRSAAAEATVRDIARHGWGTEHLSERLAADPVLEAMFVDAVDGAVRTGMEASGACSGGWSGRPSWTTPKWTRASWW